MNRNSLLSCALALSLLTAAGCGGGGVGTQQPSIALQASKAIINYGETVSISWTSQQVTSLTSRTNFPVLSSQTSGSITDRPATTTTYIVRGVDTSGEEVSGSVQVEVRPTARTFHLLGDASLAGVPQIATYLQNISGSVVPITQSVPQPIVADVLVVLKSANIGPSQHATIQSFLASGGRLVLVGRAVNKLANGNEGNPDVSTIGAWFAGATTAAFSITAIYTPSASPGVPLSAVHYGKELLSDVTTGPVANDAVLLTSNGDSGSGGFVYRPPLGGRLGFVGGMSIDSSASGSAARGIFLSACRWVASDL